MHDNPSQRISLIREITTLLEQESWSIIDLTLNQFGCPTTESWNNNDKGGYLIHMLNDVPTNILAQLKYHLGAGKEPVTEESISFWQPGQFKLFISHVSAQRERASKIRQALNNYHISSFVAHVDIEPTKEWQDEIELALNTCDCLLAVLTDDFHHSKWTDQEIGIAMGRSVLILPVDFGIKPYGFISKYQAVVGHDRHAGEFAEEIFNILLKHSLTKLRMADALINRFESSYSWEAARSNMTLLEGVTYLDKSLIQRIRNAQLVNAEIANSFGVPQRIERLVNRFER